MNATQRNQRRRQATHATKLRTIPEDCRAKHEHDARGNNHRKIQDHDCVDHSPMTVRETRQVETNYLKSPTTLHLLDDAMEMVHQQRAKHGLRPFRWSRRLSNLAAQHAKLMAKRGTVFHSVPNLSELIVQLSSPHVAENVQRGHSFQSMHNNIMENAIPRMNVLSEQFTEFGLGMAVGNDRKLYSCQLFRKPV
jgi:uncharacterized protein YkwD